MPYRLSLRNELFAVCRLDPSAPVPVWALSGSFVSVTRTQDELSIVCPAAQPTQDVMCERGWRLLKVEGPLALSLVGVLASIVTPLADHGISLLAIGTYETDYILVPEAQCERAIEVLGDAGHSVERARHPSVPAPPDAGAGAGI